MHFFRKWKTDGISIFILLVLSLAGYRHLLKPGEMIYSPFSDFVSFNLGNCHVVSDLFRNMHDFPFWRADTFSGYPAFANLQMPFTDVFYFPIFFFDFTKIINWLVWFHFLFHGMAFYVAGRIYGFRRRTCLFLGIAGLFSFKLILGAYAGWTNIISVIVLYPLFFSLAFSLLKKPAAGTMLWLTLAGVAGLLAGHFQFIYYPFLFILLSTAAYTLFALIKGGGGNLKRSYGYLFAALFLCAGIVSFRYIPVVYDILSFVRQHPPYNFFLSGHALTLKNLSTLVYPEMLGTSLDGTYANAAVWEEIAYFGIVPLAFAGIGALAGLFGKEDRDRRFLAVSYTCFFFLALILTFDAFPLRFLYQYFPGFKLCRVPARFLFSAAYFGTVLAGMGFETTLQYLERRLPSPRVVAGVLSAACMLFMAGEGAYYARQYIDTAPRSLVLPATGYQKFFNADQGLYRIATTPHAINYAWAAPMGLQLIGGYDPFSLRHYREYFNCINYGRSDGNSIDVALYLYAISRPDLLDALNVKYLVANAPIADRTGRFRLVTQYRDQITYVAFGGFTRRDVLIYENRFALNRAFWSPHVLGAATGAQARALLAQNTLPGNAVVQRNGVKEEYFEPLPQAAIRVAGSGAGRLTLTVRNGHPGYMVVSEVWHPGWQATLDGKRAPLYQTDLALMGMYVPAGEHLVSLRFRPPYLVPGCIISVVSVCVFAAICVIVIIRSRRAGKGQQPARS